MFERIFYPFLRETGSESGSKRWMKCFHITFLGISHSHKGQFIFLVMFSRIVMFKSDGVLLLWTPFQDNVGVPFVSFLVTVKQFVHLAYFHQIYWYTMELATSVLLTAISIINQWGNDLFYSLSFFSNWSKKWTMSTFVLGGYIIKMNCDIAFVRLVSLKSDINLKLNKYSDRVINWLDQ